MHQSVASIWRTFSEPLEGRVSHLYADIKCLLTAGVGNLADPVSLALKMPWRLPDGSLAPPDRVRAEWAAVKAQAPRLAKLHYKYAAPYSTIRLTDDDIDAMVMAKLLEFEAHLKRTFTEWDSFPADAQLGILSMSWALGAGFTKTFGNFTRHVLAGNWDGAGASCAIRYDNNPGVRPRNDHNRLCFANAATVTELGMRRDILHWPGAVSLKSEPMIPTNPPPKDDALDRHLEKVGVSIADEVRDNLTPDKPDDVA